MITFLLIMVTAVFWMATPIYFFRDQIRHWLAQRFPIDQDVKPDLPETMEPFRFERHETSGGE